MVPLKATLEHPTAQLRRLYRHMARREFVASRDELIAIGFTPSRIDNWARTGRLVKVVHGVYSYGRDIDSAAAASRAALLAAGPGAALTGQSACASWGLVDAPAGVPPTIEIAVNRGRTRRLATRSPALQGTAVSLARRDILPGDVTARSCLPVVIPALALIEFAARATVRDLRFAFLEACRLGLFTERDVGFCFNRMIRRNGAKKLRPHLELWVPELARIRSGLEGWFLLAWAERGYPMPKVNEKIFGYEVDAYWPEQKTALELDGHSFHADPARKRLDIEKQRHLERHGIGVVRITYGQFAGGPEREVDNMARRLAFV